MELYKYKSLKKSIEEKPLAYIQQELPGPETCVMEYEETCNKVRT